MSDTDDADVRPREKNERNVRMTPSCRKLKAGQRVPGADRNGGRTVQIRRVCAGGGR
jgi:hypothetical protein